MNRNIFVSIIVPVYNTPEPLLISCVESVRNQTDDSWELIIIDDGSVSECAAYIDKICKDISNTRVFHKKNEGVSTARNIGVKYANSEWITFLDSDNTLPKDAIKDYKEIVEKYNNEKIDLVIGFCSRGQRVIENNVDIISLSTNAETIKKASCGVELINDKNELVNHLLTNQINRWIDKNAYFADGPVGKLIRKEIVQKVLFPIELKWDEDTVWLLNCVSESKEIIIIPNIVYNSIDFEYSATRKFRENCINEFFDVCIEEKKLEVKFPNCVSSLSYRRFSNILLTARLYFFHKDNPDKVNRVYKDFVLFTTNDTTKSVAKDVLLNIHKKNFRSFIFRLFSFCILIKFNLLCWQLLKFYSRKR